MYSVVLMMALSTGGDATPAGLLHRGGHGCCGGSAPASCGCSGGYGGGYGGGCLGGGGYGGGCLGGGHHRLGLFHRHRGGHGCCGAEAACCAPTPCCAPAPVAYGCQGGAMLNPQPLPPAGGMKGPGGKEPVPAPKPKTGTQLSAPATIFVDLPASATLTVDGVATQSSSATRVLATPALDRGTEYHYTLRAELVRDGQSVSTTQRITVRAGEETRVALTFGDNVVAQR